MGRTLPLGVSPSLSSSQILPLNFFLSLTITTIFWKLEDKGRRIYEISPSEFLYVETIFLGLFERDQSPLNITWQPCELWVPTQLYFMFDKCFVWMNLVSFEGDYFLAIKKFSRVLNVAFNAAFDLNVALDVTRGVTWYWVWHADVASELTYVMT